MLHLRADASASLGLGHAMRQFAVAEAARDRGVSVRFVGTVPEVIARMFTRMDVSVEPPSAGWLTRVHPGDALVIDGCRFGSDEFGLMADTGASVGVVEDTGVGFYPVDVLLNPNLVDDLEVESRPETRRLVGPTYALIRREFRERRRERGEILRDVVVTMGGSDPSGLTAQVTQAVLYELPEVKVHCVLGPLAPDFDLQDERIQMEHAPVDIAELFDRADAAVSAAGSTTWELLCMGIPTVLIQVAEDQEYVARPVADRGAALFAGRSPLKMADLSAVLRQLHDSSLRGQLSATSLTLVDGLGADRFLDVLLDE